MKVKTHEDFVQKLKQEHPSLIVIGNYINRDTYLIVQDELGISYNVKPHNLFKGHKPTIKSAINKTNAFQIKLSSIHPNLKIVGEYINDFQPIIIEDELGIKYKTRPSRLMSGELPNFRTALDKQSAFEVTSNYVHNYKYSYTKSIYINCFNSVIITCPKHGDFKCRPDKHLTGGRGCAKCSYEEHPGGMQSRYLHYPKSKIFIYFFRCYNETEEFYKIGLSKNPAKRIYQIPYNIEILNTFEGIVEELFPIEQEYHKKFKKLKTSYIPEKFFNGYTECFKIKNNNEFKRIFKSISG
jgi:hypothetical protein